MEDEIWKLVLHQIRAIIRYVGIWGFKCPVQAGALRDWSARCGIDWSIPPEQQADRPPAPTEDKRQLYGPVNMMGWAR
jgi:hypothetical protein